LFAYTTNHNALSLFASISVCDYVEMKIPKSIKIYWRRVF